MKLLSFEKMASIEGGAVPSETRACSAANTLYKFGVKINSRLLIFLASALIENLCSSGGGGDAS